MSFAHADEYCRELGYENAGQIDTGIDINSIGVQRLGLADHIKSLKVRDQDGKDVIHTSSTKQRGPPSHHQKREQTEESTTKGKCLRYGLAVMTRFTNKSVQISA